MNSIPLEEETTVSAKKLALNYGLIWAAINIVIFLFAYYAFPQVMGTFTYTVIQIIIGVGLAVYFTLQIRRQIGGFWTFREAISAIFVLFILPSVVVMLFSIAFGKWIDPSYNDFIKESTLNMTTELLEKVSNDQDMIDKTIEETEVALDKQLNPSFVDVLKSLATSVLMYFIISLIWAAIFKRDRPIFLTQSEAEKL